MGLFLFKTRKELSGNSNNTPTSVQPKPTRNLRTKLGEHSDQNVLAEKLKEPSKYTENKLKT